MARDSSSDDVGIALRGLQGGRGRAVLIIEPNPDLQARLARQVTVQGHRVIGTGTLDGALALLRAFPVDLVLLSEPLLGADPLCVVGRLVSSRPNARVVIMTAPVTPDESDRPDRPRQPAQPHQANGGPVSAVRPSRPGALEYITRPFSSDLLSTLLA